MKKKVLVIDDELSLCEVIKDFLDSLGYQTYMAIDAIQGLEMIEREKPDVVLLDILMPEVSGLECLQRIKKSRPNTIVIIISGMQDEELAKSAIRHGAYDYITKPFDLDFLENNLLARIFPS